MTSGVLREDVRLVPRAGLGSLRNFWGHEIGDLRLSLLALLAFTFLFLGLAAWALHRKDPVRTLR